MTKKLALGGFRKKIYLGQHFNHHMYLLLYHCYYVFNQIIISIGKKTEKEILMISYSIIILKTTKAIIKRKTFLFMKIYDFKIISSKRMKNIINSLRLTPTNYF